METLKEGLRPTSILAQWRHYPRLKKQCEMRVCRPQGSAWKPPLPQYAKTLAASVERTERKAKFDKHLRQRGKTLAKPLEREKFKIVRKRAEVKIKEVINK
jgi:hypothetical protein